MQGTEEIKSKIENNHILLDTNVCSAAEDYVDTDYFKDFFDFLEDKKSPKFSSRSNRYSCDRYRKRYFYFRIL